MKRFGFLFLLLLGVSFLASAQYSVHTYRPVVSSLTIDSLVVTIGEDTVTALNAGNFDSTTVGMKILSTRFPLGTTVAAIDVGGDTLVIRMSQKAIATDTLATIQFEDFVSTAYGDGDAFGFPFLISDISTIHNILLTDDADVTTSVEIAIFSGTFIPSLDNAAFGPSDSDVDKIIAFTLLDSLSDLGANKVVTRASSARPIILTGGGPYWAQLICTGSFTITSTNGLTVRIVGE